MKSWIKSAAKAENVDGSAERGTISFCSLILLFLMSMRRRRGPAVFELRLRPSLAALPLAHE